MLQFLKMKKGSIKYNSKRDAAILKDEKRSIKYNSKRDAEILKDEKRVHQIHVLDRTKKKLTTMIIPWFQLWIKPGALGIIMHLIF
jgi:hypothetical protein